MGQGAGIVLIVSRRELQQLREAERTKVRGSRCRRRGQHVLSFLVAEGKELGQSGELCDWRDR